MTPQAYGKEMTKVVDRQYHHGVYETGKRVAERLIAYYVKPKADAACNTESMKQLTYKLECRVKDLEEQIELMQEEYESAVNEVQGLKIKIIDCQHAKHAMQ